MYPFMAIYQYALCSINVIPGTYQGLLMLYQVPGTRCGKCYASLQLVLHADEVMYLAAGIFDIPGTGTRHKILRSVI